MKHELKEIFAVVNNKGGVGKTTTVQSLAAAMVRLNPKYRVLVIDIDPQCNLSSLMGLNPRDCRTVFDAMRDQSGLTVYKCYNGVYAACGSAQMQDIENYLPGGSSWREKKRAYYVLARCIQDGSIDDKTGEGLKSVFEDFDYVLIDCPPALSMNTYNAMVAASSLLIPVQMQALSVRGLGEILNVFKEVNIDGLNTDLNLAVLLPVMLDKRTKITGELLQLLHDRFDDVEEEKTNPDKKDNQKLIIFEPGIRICSKVADSQKVNHSVYDDYPYCPAAIDYTLTAKKLIEKQ